MTDVAVDASTPGVPAAVFDVDWRLEVGPVDVLGCGGCGVRPGPGEDGWVAGAGLGAWLGAGAGKHRIHKMQSC
jgi:hypothetical protein